MMKIIAHTLACALTITAVALACASLFPTGAQAQAVAAPAPAFRLADCDGDGIAWHTDPTDIIAAMRQAVADGTPVLVVLHADWCPWCRRMDAETFQDPNVIALSRRFVCIEVDTDTPFGQAFARQLNSSSVPTTALYTSSGSLQPLVVGYEDAADYAAAMQAALDA
jgi:thiol:disulfide interchange protein